MPSALTFLYEEKVKKNGGMEERAFAEVLQAIALLGLSRSDFFKKAAFYGGTALRMLYGLDRFSEDLDFSLLTVDPAFKLEDYFGVVDTELRSFGLEATLVKKKKLAESKTESAFIKASTLKQILMITSRTTGEIAMPENQVTKVKFEIDIDPPEGAVTEVRYIDTPVPFALRVYDLPSLFSGKMHALLARAWKTRVKGRDWYDFVFYVTRGVPLSLLHLEARLRQTGHYTDSLALTQDGVKVMLERKIESTDFEAAKRDVEPFIPRPQDLNVWSKDFFFHLAQHIIFQ